MKSKIAVLTGHLNKGPKLIMAVTSLAGAIERQGDEVMVDPGSLNGMAAVFLPWIPGISLPDLGHLALPVVAVDLGKINDPRLDFETATVPLVEILDETDILFSGTPRLEHCFSSIRHINRARGTRQRTIALSEADVLFVEDEPAMILSADRMFSKVTRGKVVTVNTVEQARSAAAGIPIVMLDGSLGIGGSYRETDQLAQELMDLPHRPLVFRWTGGFGDIKESGYGVLPKPLRQGELNSRLSAVVSLINQPFQNGAAA